MSQEMLSYKPRSALGDVTNQVGKKGFCSIYKKDESVLISKKECLRVDENYNTQIKDSISRPQLCGQIDSLTGSIVGNVSKVVCEIKEPCPPDVRQNATLTSSATVNDGDVVKDVCESTQLITSVPPDENGIAVPQVELNRVVGNDLGMDDGNGVSLDKLDLIKDECLDWSRLLESRSGLERCIGQKGDGSSNVCMDMIKTCSCSFCRKGDFRTCFFLNLYLVYTRG
ncbi:hypothetical protein HanRHA438_Chr09g0403691 [Helianthus annuus]|uniref:Uncharacterized protein n=1 Tax=Helianthus annuus TaxID=4232 RepID=A0A9K3I6M2_HELAN|nr:hypothetical protein HanXRQr2_Chr09g0391961 [Helianthus annuus]KAJ0526311.1 hypothetical protein HanHA300_Chr09g0321721 [Helianthus annuus]KAJ0534719.1 hypothetical protein HanIR_Chr09g0422831 [Helianthus annuus]KAJ0542702.1 hypothetical protein HanHA89_Chr09g0342671 [Helianthus annuus]KAJ0707762.1 hypothetical protein HanLR1_Chr09g0322001 [Helianthus annuus]